MHFLSYSIEVLLVLCMTGKLLFVHDLDKVYL